MRANLLQSLGGKRLRQRRGHDAALAVQREAARRQMDQFRLGRLEKTTQDAHLVRIFLMVSRSVSAAMLEGKPTHSCDAPHDATATLRSGPVPTTC